jgi:hypothetical protein
MITVSIHQPCYLASPQLLEKVARADLFIHLDDAPYSKNSDITQNRILSAHGPVLLSIPTNGSLGMTIRDLRTLDDDWKPRHCQTLLSSYAPAPFFGPGDKQELAELYNFAGDQLVKINVAFTEWLCRQTGISTPTILASSLGIRSFASQRLLDLCRAVGAGRYLASPSDYLDLESFERAGIEVQVQNYHDLPYPQHSALREFVPGLSGVDMLFNLGPRCLHEILARGEWSAPGSMHPAAARAAS